MLTVLETAQTAGGSSLVTIREPATSTWVGWVSEAQPTTTTGFVKVGCASLTHPTRSIEGFPDSLLVQVSQVLRRIASGPGGEFSPGEALVIRSGTPGFPAQVRLNPPG